MLLVPTPRTSGTEAAARLERRAHVWPLLRGRNPAPASDGSFCTADKLLEGIGADGICKRADSSSWLGLLARSLTVKRYFDVVVSTVLLTFLSPLLLAIAVAIRWDSAGPVLITQNRNGLNKSEFRIFKFRTMTVVEDGDTAVQCKMDDLRVTHVGIFLRQTSIDELPQLVNVLKGEMSLVGPRPHPVRLDRELATQVLGYERRFAALPGITGLAQVRGFRGPVETRAQIWNRVASDVEYIENRTVMGDLGILLRTLSVVFHSFRRA